MLARVQFRSRCTRAALAGLLCSVLCAACQPLPHPFQPAASAKRANPLLDLPDRSGVFVRAVSGVPKGKGRQFAADLADELVRRNVPASPLTANRASYTLSGHILELAPGGDDTTIQMMWTLTDPEARTIGRRIMRLHIPAEDWQAAEPWLLAELSRRSAAEIAGLIQPAAPVDRLAAAPKRELYVLPIRGAPERAGALLRSEMASALAAGGLRIGSRRGPDSILVRGTVSIRPLGRGQQELAVAWLVTRADGTRLGALDQKNPVATEALEDGWPQLANAIAGAAASGIRDLMDRLPASALAADGKSVGKPR